MAFCVEIFRNRYIKEEEFELTNRTKSFIKITTQIAEQNDEDTFAVDKKKRITLN